jgi:hypothetical protein
MVDPVEYEQLRGQVFTSYQQGDYPHTLRLALESVGRFPEHRAEATFWVACMHSLLGDPDGAVHVRQDALQAGMWWAPTRLRDPDLDAARESVEFAALSSESERIWSEACSDIEPIVRLHIQGESSGRLLVVLHGWTAHDDDMEPLWASAAETGLTVAYVRSSQPDTSDRTRFYWGDAEHTSQDVAKAIEMARDRLGQVQHTVRQFPVAEGAARGVRVWLLVGEEDRFREANESLAAALRERHLTSRLTLVPGLGHDLPKDLPQQLHLAIPFALDQPG